MSSLFELLSFGGKILTHQSIKGKTNISFLIFLFSPLSSSFPSFPSHKGSRANFWWWIIYFWREYANGVDEEANGDSLKEGIDFVVGEGNSSSYELEAFTTFLLSHHLFEGYPHERILSRHFPLAIKLARGQSFPLAPYFLGTLYSHLDHFTLDLQRSWGRFQVETFVSVAFLQIWLWEHFRNYAPIPKVLSSYKTSLPSPQGLPCSWCWNKVAVSSNSFLSKVLDDPTDWTSIPYSALEGGLSPLFTSLENISISRYRDTPWSEELSFIDCAFPSHFQAHFQDEYETQSYNPYRFDHQLGFDQGILGHLSTSALPTVVASLAFKKENLVKI